MGTFIALLRGINVGGRNRVAMTELKTVMEGLGFVRVATYLQSGNAVFDAEGGDTVAMASAIEDQLQRDIGQRVPALVLSASEMRRIVLANPFVPSDAVRPEWLHVTFLFEHGPDPEAASLDVVAVPGERAVQVGSVVYLCLPTGYGHTKLHNAYFEKSLGVRATTRNWRTVRALAELADTREGERGGIDPQ